MPAPLPDASLEQVFTRARTFGRFTARPVDDDLLRRLYDLAKWGPTSVNGQPMRIVFVKSDAARGLLKDAVSSGNVPKVLSAPVTAIVAYDTRFFEYLPRLWHSPGAFERLAGSPAAAEETAFRNSTLQGAYLIVAARMLGLDAGPMSGFDPVKVNAAFFSDGRWTVNFLVNLGYGDDAGTHPRAERLAFDEAVRVL